MASTDHDDSAGFPLYPAEKVLGVLDAPRAADEALQELRQAGIPEEGLEVLCGEEGAKQIDPTGEEHGTMGKVLRILDAMYTGIERDNAERYEAELRAGHYVVAVPAPEDEDRERIADILQAHGGHFINYYGEYAVTNLRP